MRISSHFSFASLLMVLTLACRHHGEEGEGEGEGEGEQVDADGDGFTVDEGDCDDAEPTASPAQAEICDGLDNDCDDTVDETGAVGESVVYTDADGDGYGAGAALSTAACPSAGLSVFDTDCDDADATVSPGVSEVCADGLDNDCDADVDEADAVAATWYPDRDGDGYGNAEGLPEESCEQPDSHVLDHSDCDDTDEDQSPGALDRRDELDNDCDGEVDEAPHSFDGWLVVDTSIAHRVYLTHGTPVEDHSCAECEWVYETYFYLSECESTVEGKCDEYYEWEAEDPGRQIMGSPWFGFGPSDEDEGDAIWQSLEVDGDFDPISESASWDSSTGLLVYTLVDSGNDHYYGEALVY